MAREKIKIKKIEDVAARQVTFSKRRRGLIKKARELSILCEAEVAVIVFSPSRRLYHFSSSNINDILNKFFLHLGSGKHPVGLQGENRTQPDLWRGLEDKNNCLRHITPEYLQQFSAEELRQLQMKLEPILKYVKTQKRELRVNEGPAIQPKDVQTRDTIRTQSGECNHSAQETSGRISEMKYAKGAFSPYFPTAQSRNTNYPARWIPPPTDVYKVNFAGANFQDVNASGVGVGVVVRNWRGEFMAALARFFTELMDIDNTSWMAAKCGIEFAVDYYFTHVVLEGDAPNIIEGLQNTYEDHSPAPTRIIQEAKRYMRQSGSCSFSHVQPSGNTAAHMVAQYARNVGDEHVWLMKEPDFLGNVLLHDIVQLNF